MEALLHFLIPISILLIAGFKKKHVLILSILALLPDLDVIIPPRRAFFHNIFALIIVIVVSYFIAKKKKLGKQVIIIAAFMYASHLLLDASGIAWFYPVSDMYYGYEANITVNKLTYQITPHITFASRQGYDPAKKPYSYLLSPDGFYILGVLAVFVLLIKLLKPKLKN